MIVQDINDNAPMFLKEYRPVLPEHVPPRKVVEVLATDDDDRSKSNGPPFTFRMDPNADDIIRASFKVEHDQSKLFFYFVVYSMFNNLSIFQLIAFVNTVKILNNCLFDYHNICVLV